MEVFYSVVIPTYNRANFLVRTIDSLLNQNFQNWEAVIVDDGSTDNTKEVVRSFKDPRIQYYFKKNEERSIARNYGITKARGKYICFLDSDDEFFSNHLEALHRKIEVENFPVAILNTGMFINQKGKKIKRPVYSEADYSHPVYFIWEKFMLPSSVCVHRKILELHKFPEQYNVWEDTHLWLRIAAMFPFFQIDKITSQWNVHKEGTVEKAFARVSSKHVKNYINCTSHLFKNYRKVIEPFLKKKDFKDYQFKKLKMFLSIAFNKKQYVTFGILYWYGIFKVDFKKVTKFAKLLIRNEIRMKVHSLKTR